MSDVILSTGTPAVRTELDIQISTAKAFPRNIPKCIEEAIAMATLDEETAADCIYSKPRGKETDGKQEYIKGESIRLAEILISAWGNIQAGTRVLESDGKTITGEGVVWDLERNVRISIAVKRSIVNKFGKTFSADMQVVTGNAAASIGLRNSTLKVIPRAIVKKVYAAAVNCAIGDQKKLTEKVKALFGRFEKLGIGREKIFTYFKKNDPAEFTLDEVEEMIGIGTAIKENDLTIEQAFVEVEEPSAKANDLDAKLDAAKKQPAKTTHTEETKGFADALGDV
jgi:hypothetical protein